MFCTFQGFFRNIDWLEIYRWIDLDTALCHRIACYYSFADWDGLCDHLRDFLWGDIFKLSVFVAASEFCEWVQVIIDVYIPHWKCQVKPDSSPWFSATCAAAIVHRNHCFVCTKRINLLNLKENSERLVIIAKRFSKLPNLHIIFPVISTPWRLLNFGTIRCGTY